MTTSSRVGTWDASNGDNDDEISFRALVAHHAVVSNAESALAIPANSGGNPLNGTPELTMNAHDDVRSSQCESARITVQDCQDLLTDLLSRVNHLAQSVNQLEQLQLQLNVLPQEVLTPAPSADKPSAPRRCEPRHEHRLDAEG
ncbi:hypothetical protein H4R35_005653 [Dimargaris xerosporica]|nr:hypothetical protein H4R35_005653 [Dimargaris xerosporica]